MKPSAIILSAATGYGGAERSLEMLLPLLTQDYEVRILVQNTRHLEACRGLRMSGSPMHISVLCGGPRFIQLAYGMFWLLNAWLRHAPRFILANNNKSAMLAALASIVAPPMARRMILYIRDFEWRHRVFIFKRLRQALFLIPSPALLDPPDYLAPWVVPRGTSRCEVVMNAVAVRTHALPSTDSAPPYIILPGTIQEWKGHEYVVRALAKMPSNLRAIFVGDVQDRDYYAQLVGLAKDLGLSGRIEFRPFDPDIFRVLSNSVCVVIASVARAGGPETFGRTVLEAWAARRPVVAFAVGGPLYLIENRVTGVLVPPGDVDALSDAVKELMEDGGLAERLASNGYDHAQDFRPDRIYSDLRGAIGIYL